MTRYLCEKLIPGDRVHVHGVLTLYNSQKRATKHGKMHNIYFICIAHYFSCLLFIWKLINISLRRNGPLVFARTWDTEIPKHARLEC